MAFFDIDTEVLPATSPGSLLERAARGAAEWTAALGCLRRRKEVLFSRTDGSAPVNGGLLLVSAPLSPLPSPRTDPVRMPRPNEQHYLGEALPRAF